MHRIAPGQKDVYGVLTYYINKIQQYATDAGIYYCKITLHVSGVYRTHHQEYINCNHSLWYRSYHVSGQLPSVSVALLGL
jgi:hypothetical protein